MGGDRDRQCALPRDQQVRQDELERAVRGLEATVSLNREVGGETDLRRVQELVVKRGRALADAHSAVLMMFDGSEPRVADVAGELDSALIGKRLPGDDSPALDVLRANRTQAIEGSAMAGFATLGIESPGALLVPLRSRGHDLGVLALFARIGADGEFSRDDRLALESFATSAGTAIDATRSSRTRRSGSRSPRRSASAALGSRAPRRDPAGARRSQRDAVERAPGRRLGAARPHCPNDDQVERSSSACRD